MTATLERGPASPTAGPGPLLHRSLLPERWARPALIGLLVAVPVFPLALALTGSPVVAGGAALAVVAGAVAVTDPFLALLVFVGLEVSQTGAVLAGLGVPSPLVLSQALALGALGLALLRGRLRLPPSPVLLGAGLLLASRGLSVLTAKDAGTAFGTTVSDAKDLLTLLVAYVLLVHTRGVRGVLRAAVLVLAGLALLSGVQEYVIGNDQQFLGFSQSNPPDVGAASFRHSGPIPDPNFWGRVLLMFLPFAVALALAARARRSRLLWWGAAASLTLGVFLSQSRGAFLAAFGAIVVLLLLAGWHYARWLVLTPVVVALLLLVPATGDRLTTLADLGESSQGGGDLSLVLRLASQEAGLRMFRENPWFGVGAGNYEELTPQYETGLTFATVGELGRPLAPHNAFLEYLAEGGVVGLIGLLAFLGSMVFCALRAWRTAGRRAPPGRAGVDRLLAAACLAAVAGWSVASIVLHVRQFRTLLVLAAVVAALDHFRGPDVPRRPLPTLPWRAWARSWAVLLALAGVAGLALAGPVQAYEQGYRATVVAVVSARGAPGFLDAYHYDLLTRGGLIPTLGEVVTSRSVVARSLALSGLPQGSVEVRAGVVTRPRSGDLELRADGTDPELVQAFAGNLATTAAQSVDRLRTPFQLTVSDTGRRAEPVRTLRPAVPIGVATWLLLAAVLLWRQLQQAHRRIVQAAA